MLELKNVSLTYFSENGETQALKDITMQVKNKDFVAIVGPSGSGKTTILSLISGLLKATSGTITLNGKTLNPADLKTGYMFQKDHLFEWRSVLKNIYLGIEIKEKRANKHIYKKYINIIKQYSLKRNKKRLVNNLAKFALKESIKNNKIYANNLLKKYGLWEFRDKYPNQLSGGMRQRVALIRTLTLYPEILLLDEPFSALDYQTRINLCEDVYKIIKTENKTAILVTHDITEALSMANTIIVLSKRPAIIQNVYNVNINDNLTPLQRRETGKFLTIFDKIWKELQDEEDEK